MFSRRTRRLFALFTLTALMFANIAVSAYACPMMNPGTIASQAAAADAPCPDETSVAQPGLCHKHCEDGQQNVSDASDPPVSVFLPAFVLPSPVGAVPPDSAVTFPPELFHATSPPLAIQYCCFRI